MLEEMEGGELYTYENQKQIQAIPSLDDHVIVEHLTLV